MSSPVCSVCLGPIPKKENCIPNSRHRICFNLEWKIQRLAAQTNQLPKDECNGSSSVGLSRGQFNLKIPKLKRNSFRINCIDHILEKIIHIPFSTLNILVCCLNSSTSTPDTGLADNNFPVFIITLAIYSDQTKVLRATIYFDDIKEGAFEEEIMPDNSCQLYDLFHPGDFNRRG